MSRKRAAPGAFKITWPSWVGGMILLLQTSWGYAQEEVSAVNDPRREAAVLQGDLDECARSDMSLSLRPQAPSEPLVTDRPDFTESAQAVTPGYFQLEMGYTFTHDREGATRVRDHAAPEFLLRVGLPADFELRLGWAGYSFTHVLSEERTRASRRVLREDATQGAQDVTLGFKYVFFDQEGLRPNLGVIGEISVPSGSAGSTAGDVDPIVKVLWAYDLTDRLALAGNVNFGVPTAEDADRFLQTAASISLAISLTERWGAYVEYFGFYPNVKDGECAHVMNGGLTYLVNDDVQLDWRVGGGMNDEADDFFTGVGLSWRF